MNGQNFHFHGYLPIDALERKKKIQALETEIKQTGVTQLFIETPIEIISYLKQSFKIVIPAPNFVWRWN